MKESWNVLKLGVYIFTLPLVATAAASAHQWMTSSAVVAVAPAVPVASSSVAPVPRINAVRNHTITLNADGEVQGRVASINHKTKIPTGLANVKIYFYQNEKIAKKGFTNPDGTFLIKGLKEGVYSFVAASEWSFATCGVKVVAGEGNVESYIEIASISPNVEAVKQFIETEMPDSFDEVAGDASMADANSVVGSNRVELDGDVLRGKILSLTEKDLNDGIKAHLMKANSMVTELAVQSDGTFEVSGIEPGVYDLVAVGKSGVAAVSFEAVGSIDETSAEAYTALQDNLFSNFIVALAPAPQFSGAFGGSGAIVYGSSPAQFVGDNLGGSIAAGGACGTCGDFGGCCGGAAGGGFGVGGIGRWLLIPALAAGIAIPLAVSGGGDVSPDGEDATTN